MSARNNVPLAIFLFIGAVSLNSIKDGISKLLSAEITPVTFLSIQYMFLVIILSVPINLSFSAEYSKDLSCKIPNFFK